LHPRGRSAAEDGAGQLFCLAMQSCPLRAAAENSWNAPLQPGSGRLAARRLRQIAAREGRLRGSFPGQGSPPPRTTARSSFRRDTALGDLMRDYERFLSSERGLAPATLINYLPFVRRFLIERFGNDALRLDELHPIDIHRFIRRHVLTGSRGRAKLLVTALRSFLHFLHQRGAIGTDLAVAVPGVANWRLSHLPKSLSPDQVERLLTRCDRSTLAGQRDYAILLFWLDSDYVAAKWLP
jgi:integrase